MHHIEGVSSFLQLWHFLVMLHFLTDIGIQKLEFSRKDSLRLNQLAQLSCAKASHRIVDFHPLERFEFVDCPTWTTLTSCVFSVVMNFDGFKTLACWQAKSSSFIDAGGRSEVPGLETNDLISQSNIQNIQNIKIFFLGGSWSPSSPRDICVWTGDTGAHGELSYRRRTLRLGNLNNLEWMGSMTVPPSREKSYFYYTG